MISPPTRTDLNISSRPCLLTATAWPIALVAMANTGITGRIMQLATVLVSEAWCTPFERAVQDALFWFEDRWTAA